MLVLRKKQSLREVILWLEIIVRALNIEKDEKHVVNME